MNTVIILSKRKTRDNWKFSNRHDGRVLLRNLNRDLTEPVAKHKHTKADLLSYQGYRIVASPNFSPLVVENQVAKAGSDVC